MQGPRATWWAANHERSHTKTRKANGAGKPTTKSKGKTPQAPAQDWVALLERESRETAKPIEQLLAEKVGTHHPDLLKLAGPLWGRDQKRIEFWVENAELAALECLSKIFVPRDVNIVAWYAMAYALAHPKELDAWLAVTENYWRAEGFSQRKYARSLIWACKEYHKQPEEATADGGETIGA